MNARHIIREQVGYDLRFGRPPFVSHQKWHGWNCQVDIIPHGCCPVAETKINAEQVNPDEISLTLFVSPSGSARAFPTQAIQFQFGRCGRLV
jgi:hypothetical protein